DVLAASAVGWGWFAVCSIAFGGRVLRFGRPVEVAEQAVAPGAPGRRYAAGTTSRLSDVAVGGGSMSLRRWMAGVATVAVALGFVLGGVAAAKTVSPSTWAPKFCDALSSWQDALQSSSDAIESAFSAGGITDLKGA